MDFNSFPAQWEWVALIIGGVAFLMAVQPLTQVIFGRPKLVVGLGVRQTKSGESLICSIKNIPVTNKILKLLCIHRNPVDDLCVRFDILTRDNLQKIGDTFLVELHTQEGQKAKRITLPASYFPISFPIAAYHKKTQQAYIIGDAKDRGIWLKGGVFIIFIHVYYGASVKNVMRDFIIADTTPYIRLGEQREFDM